MSKTTRTKKTPPQEPPVPSCEGSDPQRSPSIAPGGVDQRIRGEFVATGFVTVCFAMDEAHLILSAMTNRGTRIARCDGLDIPACVWHSVIRDVHEVTGLSLTKCQGPDVIKYLELEARTQRLAATLMNEHSLVGVLLALSDERVLRSHRDLGFSFDQCWTAYYAAAWAFTNPAPWGRRSQDREPMATRLE